MDETFQQFIARRIHEIFLEAAEIANKQCDAEELLGVPQAIFKAEENLLAAWEAIAEAPDA